MSFVSDLDLVSEKKKFDTLLIRNHLDANFICSVVPFNQEKFMREKLRATTKLAGNLSSFSVKWCMNRFSCTHSQQKIEWILEIWNMQRQQIILSSIFLFSKSGWYIFYFSIKKENRFRLKLHGWALGWIPGKKCKRPNKSFGRKWQVSVFHPVNQQVKFHRERHW